VRTAVSVEEGKPIAAAEQEQSAGQCQGRQACTEHTRFLWLKMLELPEKGDALFPRSDQSRSVF
jgi:hypothetical protein